jgi:hypothetical protein
MAIIEHTPLYFYHLVDKNADLKNGLLSLQYMYDHGMFRLFDKNAEKYEDRIVNGWNISKYKGKKLLTREEIIDALNTIRGPYGSSYIYFFRFPPYIKLGKKIKELSRTKDIYRIDINAADVRSIILDISYGFDMNRTDNKRLNEEYYRSVSEKDYFANYNDNIRMNFSTINHIGIAFKNGNCPRNLLEKVPWA